MKLNSNKGSHQQAAQKPLPGELPINEATPKKKKKSGLRRAMVALAVIVVAVISVIIAYSMWEAPPDVIGPSPTPDQSISATPTPGIDEPVESEDPIDEFDGALVTDRDDGVYTFLVVGRDHESNSTDTIIVGKFDTKAGTIDMVNIPRDTLVNISWSSTPKRINAVYPGYTNSYNAGKTNITGIEALRTHVKNILGFDVDFYAVVNLKVVEDVIDEIGGVYFDVPVDMHYDDYGQSFHVHVDKGYQHLNGYETLGVFRFRYGGYHDGVLTEGYPGGDVQRIQVQQDLLKAIAKQLLSLGNIPNLGNVINLCLANVETTLDSGNMAFFARQFLTKCSGDSINFHDMPTSGFNFINGVSYVSIDADAWVELVNEKLNPYSEDVTLANVNILSGNYSGTYLESTSGVIAGGWESFFCQTCTIANGWTKTIHHTPGACPADEPVGEESTEPPAEETPEGGEEENGLVTELPIDPLPPDDGSGEVGLPVEPLPEGEVA